MTERLPLQTAALSQLEFHGVRPGEAAAYTLAGGLAGVLTTAALHPLDTVKTILQVRQW